MEDFERHWHDRSSQHPGPHPRPRLWIGDGAALLIGVIVGGALVEGFGLIVRLVFGGGG